MFNMLYQLFRHYSIEGMLHFAILSYTLYILCGPKKETLLPWKYVLGSTFASQIILLVIRSFLNESYYSFLSMNTLAYWVTYVESIGIQILFAHLLLKESIFYKLVYTLYFVAFLQLFKVVCSPIYLAETHINPKLYQILDLFTMAILLILLILLTYMFRKFKFYITVKLPIGGILSALYFLLAFSYAMVLL